jgi:hypothetical protein
MTTTTPPPKRSKKPPSRKDRARKDQPPTKTKKHPQHQHITQNNTTTKEQTKKTSLSPGDQNQTKSRPSLHRREMRHMRSKKTLKIMVKGTQTRSLHKEVIDSSREVVPPSTHNENMVSQDTSLENQYHKEN